MRRTLSDILYYVTLVVFWVVFPVVFVVCYGFGLGLIALICIAAAAMDVCAMIIGDEE